MSDDRAVHVPEETWQRVLAAIDGVDEVALACHVSPDGDALGSMLALTLALQAVGKKTASGFPGDGLDVPVAYRWMPGLELLTAPADYPAAPDLLVTLDTPSRDRLADMAPVADAAGDVLVVDHHERGDGYGSIRLVDTAAAATALVVEELVRRLGVPLTADIATCLYTGLITDTGSFKYASTTPAVHDVAARLLATGFDHAAVSRAVWDTHAFGYVRLLGVVCGRAVLEPGEAQGLGLAWSWTCADDLREHGLAMDQVEGLIDTVRTTAEAEVAVVCKEDVDGSFKVSTRSKGRVDVGAACASLGGGGHRLAAGFTSTRDLDATMAALRAALAETPLLGR